MNDKNLELQIAITEWDKYNYKYKKISGENEDLEISNMKWDKYEYKCMKCDLKNDHNILIMKWGKYKKT